MADTQRIYRLLVDANQATRELEKVNKNVSKFGDGIKKFGSNLKGAVAGLAAGFTLAKFSSEITSAINEMDKFTKEAQRIGVAADDLVKLQYAAELSGVSADQLSTGLKKLSVSMADLQAGKTSDAVKTIERLGISVTDAEGNMRGAEDVIADVADAFQKMPDGAGKSAAAMQVFGKSGAQLIPLLNQGSAGLAAMGDEAERLGLTFDQSIGKASEQFNDNMTRISKASDGAFRSITAGLLPSLVGLTDGLTEGSDNSETFIQIGFRLGQTLELLGQTFNAVTGLVKNFFAALTGAGKSIGAVVGAIVSGDFKNLPNTLGQIWADAATQVQANNDKITGAFVNAFEIINKDADTELNKLKERFTGTTTEIKITGSIDFSSDPATEQKKIEDEAAKLKERLKNEADALSESVRTPLEILEQKLERIKVLSGEGLLTSDVELKATTEAWKEYGETIEAAKKETESLDESSKTFFEQAKDGVQGWTDDAADAFTDFALSGKNSFSDLTASIIADLAKMAVRANIIKPLFDSLGLTTSAQGNVFNAAGITPFASGGVVNSPTLFNYNGGVGLMGESGSEAILPLTRLSNGDLGVKGSGSTTVNVINRSGGEASVTETQNANGGVTIDVMIEKAVDTALGRGRFDKSLNTHYGLRRRGS